MRVPQSSGLFSQFRVDDVWGFELLVMVLEVNLCAGLGHLDFYCGLVDASTVGLVLLQQVLSCEAVYAAFAEMLAPS